MKKKYFLFLLSFCLFGILGAQNINEATVSPRLLDLFEQKHDSKHLVYVLLADHVDAAALQANFEQQRIPVTERVAILINALKTKAANTQPDFINQLKQLEGVDASSIRPLWITNVLFMEANKEAVINLSNRADVLWMDINVENAADEAEELECALPPSPNGKEAGLTAINAPALWAMGYSGYGQIAFTADTGVDGFHPAISYKHRGYYVDDSEAWVEFNNFGNVISGADTPSNCGDHGTHTIGTVLGLDRNENDTIGVAFNGLWIGAPILCGIGTVDNLAAFQWALDPDNDPTTIEDMPDAICNSWYDPGLPNQCTSPYVAALDALEAAGIANIFSAGNEGSGSATITEPKNINTDTLKAFCVGAINGNNPSYLIADFSSRGPSLCGGEGSLLIKPEVSAPGQNVRSCELDGTYGSKSGTSMAAPHVTGAVLLLKEAFPYLTGKDLLRAIYHSCTDLGDPGEDNTYGMGMINVLEAFNLLVAQGHVPQSPYVANDALVVGVPVGDINCDAAFELDVIFENAGTASLTSLEISYDIFSGINNQNVANGTFDWTGNLANKERAEVNIPISGMENGPHRAVVSLNQPNGGPDDRPLNNKAIERFEYFSTTDFNVSIIGQDTTQSCNQSNTLLYCDFEGSGTIRWYSVATGGFPIAGGNYYLTPELGFDLTFYAEVKQTTEVGKFELDEDASAIDNSDGRLVLDAVFPFTIKSVKMYAEDTGPRLVQLYDQFGMVLAEKTINVAEVGEQRQILNLDVPVGENMALAVIGADLAHSTEADYPYDIGGLGTIKRSNHPAAPLDTWYYFYNWEVEADFNCGRKAVFVDVDTENNSTGTQFSISMDTIDFNQNENIDFTDESEDAISWNWNFGDGTSSEEQNPSHLYVTPGSYTVSLTTANGAGCTDTEIMTITVEQLVNNKELNPLGGHLHLYPNPTVDQLFIDYSFEKEQKLELIVLDALGRTIHRISPRTYSKGQKYLDCSDWPQGLYYIVFSNGEERLVRKMVKI